METNFDLLKTRSQMRGLYAMATAFCLSVRLSVAVFSNAVGG